MGLKKQARSRMFFLDELWVEHRAAVYTTAAAAPIRAPTAAAMAASRAARAT